jgi:hypothetical protein
VMPLTLTGPASAGLIVTRAPAMPVATATTPATTVCFFTCCPPDHCEPNTDKDALNSEMEYLAGNPVSLAGAAR